MQNAVIQEAEVYGAVAPDADKEDGIDMKVLQYLMGHSSARITNDVYNHVTEDRAANEVISIVGKRRNMA